MTEELRSNFYCHILVYLIIIFFKLHYLKSYLFAIVGAEYVLKWLPIGTHDWGKFLTPHELEVIAYKKKFIADDSVGMKFDIFSKKWFKSDDTSVNYISTFLKS